MAPRFAVLVPNVPDEPRRTKGEGHAAIASVMTFWGIPTTRDMVAKTVRMGRLGYGVEEELMEYAARAGLWAYASYGTIQQLEERLRNGVPVIVGLEGTEEMWGTRWYAVVTGYDASTGRILCQTGLGQPVIYSIAEFDRKWRVLRRWMLVVCPAERPTWPLNAMELCTRAKLQDRRGRTDAAVADFEAAMRLEPTSSLIPNALGQLYQKHQNLRDAEFWYRRALELNPGDGKASNNLAYLLADSNAKLDEAFALATTAASIEPGNPVALDTLGYVYLRRGLYEDAVRTLQDAHAQALGLPGDQRADIAMRLAEATALLGQEERARQLVRDVLAIAPDRSVPASLQKLLDASPELGR